MAYPGPIASSYMLEDGGAAITSARAGKVGGNDRVYDFGADVTFNGFLILHVNALTTGSGRSYAVKGQVCASSGFSSGVIDIQPFTIAAMPAGDGEVAVIISNKVVDTKYRYGRFWLEPTGAGASITLSAWLLPASALETLSTPNLAAMMGLVAERFNQATSSFRNWSGGSSTGGPGSDGLYPLPDAAGNVQLIPCPAKLIESIGGAGLSMASINDLPTATESDVTVANPEPIVIGIVGPTGSRTLKKFSTYLINARKTKDMEPLTTLLSEELLPSYNASTGLERKIAVGELMRQTMGMVNPLHYGVKHDCRATGSQTGFSYESGDNLIECVDPIFYPACVGQYIQVGGALGGGTAGKGTITQYIDAYHVRTSFICTATNTRQFGNFGTLNTMAMQNAINACFNPAGPYIYGGILMLPSGMILTGALYYLPRMGIAGNGTRQSRLVRYDDTFMTTPGAFPRWDGDMDPFPITKYHDNTYYYPIYPNAYIAPHYAGSYVPDIAPTLCNRMGVDRWGDTWGPSDSAGGPAEIGYKVDSDLNVFNNFSLDGSRYCATRFLPGFEFRGGLFSLHDGQVLPPYNQVDPYLRMRDMEFSLHAGIPMRTFGQCSGLITNIGSYENNLCGYLHQAFDCNISGGYFMGNNGPGIVADGTNTNWTTMKISYNGDGSLDWYWGGSESRSNLYIPGIGHNWNNFRAQESYGANVFVKGRGNDFTGCHLDDTGCIYPYHIANNHAPTIAANMNWLAPGILIGPDADDLRMNDVGMGGLVHVGVNYATHAVFWLNNSGDMAARTSGRMFKKNVSGWYNPGHASYTGDRAPNEWNAQGGVAPATANLTLDGVDITTL